MIGLMTAELQADTEAMTCAHGYFIFSSNTFTTISGRKHMMKQRKMASIITVSLRSFLFRKNFSLLLLAGVESNLLSFACCLRTVLKMHEYEMMMIAQGSKKPTRKMNVFGDLPNFFKIVHEKVDGS